MKRKQLTHKQRFDVLKRDNFTCQYCGRKAPHTSLHVDHIVPVSKGGSNEMSNLVTSCKDCNYGKGSQPLPTDTTFTLKQIVSKKAATPNAPKAAPAISQENRQLEMLTQWHNWLHNFNDESKEYLTEYINKLIKPNKLTDAQIELVQPLLHLHSLEYVIRELPNQKATSNVSKPIISPDDVDIFG